MQLSPNFSLEELIASEAAARAGIENTPPPMVVTNLRALAQGLGWCGACCATCRSHQQRIDLAREKRIPC